MAPAQGWHANSWSVPYFSFFNSILNITICMTGFYLFFLFSGVGGGGVILFIIIVVFAYLLCFGISSVSLHFMLKKAHAVLFFFPTVSCLVSCYCDFIYSFIFSSFFLFISLLLSFLLWESFFHLFELFCIFVVLKIFPIMENCICNQELR